MRQASLLLAGLLCAAPLAARQEAPAPASTRAEAQRALDAALGWLVREQREDGSWGWGVLHTLHDAGFSPEAYYDYQVAAHGVALLALVRAEPTPGRIVALERGARWLADTRMVRRGNHWDVDYVWSALYGLVAAVEILGDGRFAGTGLGGAVERRGRELLGVLLANQTPSGGWAYYDDPPYTRRPKWATSFCTALVLPALRRTLEWGWVEDEAVLVRAREAVRRCALPNGAFAYSVPEGEVVVPVGERINTVKGSLGRTSTCLWGLAGAGDPRVTDERVREALDDFFAHERFLRLARLMPKPHESHYANSGYFVLFGHYYVAELIELLPPDEREGWHARLRPLLLQMQYPDGSSVDYQNATYGYTSGTAYTALALELGLRPPHAETP